jgi:hypothetical protein
MAITLQENHLLPFLLSEVSALACGYAGDLDGEGADEEQA